MSSVAHAVEKFYLRPTVHSPNSPLPVLLYRSVLPRPCTEESVKTFLEANEWERRVRMLLSFRCMHIIRSLLFRFLLAHFCGGWLQGTWGHIATAHFHPNSHECYGIFQGSSTLRIGRGQNDETGGVLIPVNTGDVIVLPAGTVHSSLDSHGDYRYVGVYPKVSTSIPGLFSYSLSF